MAETEGATYRAKVFQDLVGRAAWEEDKMIHLKIT
jgi:hypothetical protein